MDSVDLACFTGVFIFVWRYCTKYDYVIKVLFLEKLGVFFGFVDLFAICKHKSMFECKI